MRREDKFVGLVDVGTGSLVAQFEHVFPVIDIEYRCGRSYYVIHTYFRLNHKNLLIRMFNLTLPKNYGKIPWSMVQENAALAAIAC